MLCRHYSVSGSPYWKGVGAGTEPPFWPISRTPGWLSVALDSSVEAEPSLGTLGEACRMQGRTTVVLEVSAPELLHWTLSVHSGGV